MVDGDSVAGLLPNIGGLQEIERRIAARGRGGGSRVTQAGFRNFRARFGRDPRPSDFEPGGIGVRFLNTAFARASSRREFLLSVRRQATLGTGIAEPITVIPSGISTPRISDVETIAEFRGRQFQAEFQRQADIRQQTPLPSTVALPIVGETPRERRVSRIFGPEGLELTTAERGELLLGSAIVGGGKLVTELGGIAGVQQIEVREGRIEPAFRGEARAIREKPGDIAQTAVQVAPLVIAAPLAAETIGALGIRAGTGALVKGFSPIKTPTFRELSLQALERAPTRTVGVEVLPDPITGGRRFEFVGGREITPIFGEGGAQQIQTFQALQIPRAGKQPRIVIREGEAITTFRDPLTGRETFGAVERFGGGIDISRAELPVRQRGEIIPEVTGFLGRGRITQPGISQFQEFPVGGIGRKFDRRFIGVDIRPVGVGVRRPVITELTIGDLGVRARRIPRTDIDPTRFIRGEPIGRTDILLRGRREDITGDIIRIPGRRPTITPRPTQAIAQEELLGLTDITRRVQVPSPRQEPIIKLIPPRLGGVFGDVSQFTGLGLFERTTEIGISNVLLPPRQIERVFETEFIFPRERIGIISPPRPRERIEVIPRIAETPILAQPTAPKLAQRERFVLETRQTFGDPFAPTTFRFALPRFAFRPGGFIFPIPGLGFRQPKIKRAKVKRKLRRRPSLAAVVLGIEGPIVPELEATGLFERPLTPRKRG